MRDTLASGWYSAPFGSLCLRIVNGGTPETGTASYWSGETPWITGADFTSKGVGEFRRFVTDLGVRASATSVVKQGNLLVVTRTGVGKLAIAPCDIAISQDITGIYIDTQKVDTEFVYYLLSRELEELKKLNQGTSINGIVRSDLESHAVTIPRSPKIQKKLVAVFRSIDTAIEKTEALITKHQQIKAGLMHDLFTRGVLPNGQLRPPRSEAPELYRETAIGWMPIDWQVACLGNITTIVSGVTLGAKPGPSDTIDAPYLRVANVQDGYLDLSDVKTVRVSLSTLEQLRLIPGDVLMNEGGDFDKLGRGTIWCGEIADCVHQNHVFRVRTQESQLLPMYLTLYSSSSFGKSYFLRSSKQSTNLASINSTQLKAYPIALPPIEEQAAIVERLSAASQRVDALGNESKKLQNQKRGLMQDLLTGRVSVPMTSNPAETTA
jgi:type I restriction enzyme S subunit